MKYFELKKLIENYYDKYSINCNESDYIISSVCEVDLSKALFMNFDKKIINKVNRVLKKRRRGMPLDIIFKKKNFYGLWFFVNKNCLSPRQETELLVENALRFCKSDSKILEIGCGSGAVSIALKKHLPNAEITATDISKKALKIAKMNAKIHNTQIDFIKSDLFNKVENKYDLIISNPPYIKSGDIKNLDKEVKKFDPILALDGKIDGLYFYDKILTRAKSFLNDCGVILFEIGIGQAKEIDSICIRYGYKIVEIIKDYSKIERVIIIK